MPVVVPSPLGHSNDNCAIASKERTVACAYLRLVVSSHFDDQLPTHAFNILLQLLARALQVLPVMLRTCY
jgi:hypothetical protein